VVFSFGALTSENVYCRRNIITMIKRRRILFGHAECMGEMGKGKVKCSLVQALTLCTGLMAHRGSRGIALLFHDHDTRRG